MVLSPAVAAAFRQKVRDDQAAWAKEARAGRALAERARAANSRHMAYIAGTPARVAAKLVQQAAKDAARAILRAAKAEAKAAARAFLKQQREVFKLRKVAVRRKVKAAVRAYRIAVLGFEAPSPPSPEPIEHYHDDDDTCFDPAMALVKPLSCPYPSDDEWDGVNESGGRAFSGTDYPFDLGPWTGKGSWVWVVGWGWRWRCDPQRVEEEEDFEVRCAEDAAVEGLAK